MTYAKLRSKYLSHSSSNHLTFTYVYRDVTGSSCMTNELSSLRKEKNADCGQAIKEC